MKRAEALEIIHGLPNGRTTYLYHKDRYALMLLEMALESPASRQALKRSHFSQLLEKPFVRNVIGDAAALDRSTVCAGWPREPLSYTLSLDVWGSGDPEYDQVSRRGCNLVLQLNFGRRHDRAFRRIHRDPDIGPFAHHSHPVQKSHRNTLAWARLDVDVARGEALIEEIQTDWIRMARRAYQFARLSPEPLMYYRGHQMVCRDVVMYYEQALAAYAGCWDEAMLSAAIRFLVQELGVRTIFYHTPAWGAALKRIAYRHPPVSLYRQLPRRFCFAATDRQPGFLRPPKAGKRRQLIRDARFQLLEVNRAA